MRIDRVDLGAAQQRTDRSSDVSLKQLSLPLDYSDVGAGAPSAPKRPWIPVKAFTVQPFPTRRAAFRTQATATVEKPQLSLFKTEDATPWKTVTFRLDARGTPALENVALKGSFNPETGLYDPLWNRGAGTPMRDDGEGGDEVAGDRVYTAQVRLKGGQQEEFFWGATGDVQGKGGKVAPNTWLVMSELPPSFRLEDTAQPTYAPVGTHLWGVHREGRDVRFRTWSPEVGRGDLADYRVCVDLYGPEGRLEGSLPMTRQGEAWEAVIPGGWRDLEGLAYQYSVRREDGRVLTTADGAPVIYSDPHARYLQGPQRGLERIFVDPVLGFETGWYDDSGKGGPNYADNPQWARFTVDSHPDAQSVRLVLKDADGRALTKQELVERLGEPKLVPYDQARPEDKRDVDVLRNWKLDRTEPITGYSWLERANDDGSIEMKRVDSPGAGTAWVVAVNEFPKLVGLRYEFQVIKDGKVVGDANGDGSLQPHERVATPFNDPHGDVITERPGSARRSLIRESSYAFRHDNAPRKENDYRRFIIYEAHVGSFMGSKDNAVAGTFEDMIANLDYIEKLGANSIELMPTAEFGGKRDWGYTPDYYYAGSEAYGFEMDRARAVELKLIRPDQEVGAERVWIAGTDALKLFVDEAHKRGFNVFADVVYNHTSGKADGDNPLNRIDGDKKSFFKWWGQYESHTPWGAKPNYASQGVKDFFSDNAVQQVQEFGFDGIRFDFTQVLHNTGSAEEQVEGMNTLRQINRSLQFVRPGSYTVAEDFSNNWLVAADLDRAERQGDVEKKGMGFKQVWNDRYHDDLLEMASGSGNADRLMDAMLNHHGVSGWDRAVVYAHSHDEVGNTGNWIARGAAASKDDQAVKQPYPRAVARTAAAVMMTGPGVPMIFQGEEHLANNDFKHGLVSTWGADLRWLDFQVTPDRVDHFRWIAGLDRAQQEVERSRLEPAEQELLDRFLAMGPEQRAQAEDLANQAGHFVLYRELAALRRSSPAFQADAGIWRVHTHNADRVTAYKRAGGSDEFVVVSNFSDVDRPGYKVPLPEGKWREVFNTNARRFGGTNAGNGGGEVDAGTGVFLPAGATVVLRRV